MGLKNIPERRTKWIATGIFHCTEYIIDLSLKLSVNVFSFWFSSVGEEYKNFEVLKKTQ